MILFVITSISKIMLDTLLVERERSDGAIAVVTDRADVANMLSQYGIDLFLLEHEPMNDAVFKEKLMPGLLKDILVPDTKMPAWHALSLDRFKFFYNASEEKWAKLLTGFFPDKVYASFDMGSPLPWLALDHARFADIMFVKTEPIMTAEALYFIPNIADEIDFFIVDSLEDEKFLKRLGVKAEVVEKKEAEVESQERDELRKGLGIGSEELVFGVLFDKRDEWQCRKWLSQHVGNMRILVFPTDERSSALANSVLVKYLNNVNVVSNPAHMNACDQVFAFRFDDRYPNKDALSIVDYYGINNANAIKLQEENTN